MPITENKKILIADDNESVLMALEFNIQQAGYIVLTAANGKEALEIATTEFPDVIVSDVAMPEMDGIELCKKLRAIPEFSDIPFIFLTAHDEPKERVRGLKSGADDYIAKPYDMEELITRIGILYDRTEKNGHSNALSGEFRELPLPDVLQVFEQTRKEGTLFIRSGGEKGAISFRDGMIMDAAYRDLSGEDAMAEAFLLKEGSFNYKSHAVSSGAIAKPITFIMMETIRLIDEKSALEDFMPDERDRLMLKDIPLTDDPDVEAVVKVLQKGAADLVELHKSSGLSRIRTGIAIARLMRDKQIETVKSSCKIEPSPDTSAKPFKLLFVFADEAGAAEVLKKIAETFHSVSPHGIKAGAADFLKVIVSDIILHIFALRGDKRFSFLWEPMLAASYAAVFLVKSARDIEHLEFFRSRIGSDMPFYAISAERLNLSGETLRVVSSHEDIKEFFSEVLTEFSAGSRKQAALLGF